MYDSGTNLWRRESGLRIPRQGLALYAPLWHPQNNGSTFNAWDLVTPGVRTCTVTGAVWGTTGRTFDGATDYITVAGIQPLGLINTVSLWCYMANWADNTIRIFLDATKADGSNRIFLRKIASNLIHLSVTTSGVEQVNIYTAAQSGSGWKYITGLYQLNSCELLVNTVSAGTDTSCTMPTFTSSDALAIGAYTSGASSHNGIIGDVLIHSRKLSAAEISQIYLTTIRKYL